MHERGSGPALETPSTGNLLEFLGWVAARPRTYAEAMEAWRTSCPRLSAWEDAAGDGLVRVEQSGVTKHGEAIVLLTERGAAFLSRARPAPATFVPDRGRDTR